MFFRYAFDNLDGKAYQRVVLFESKSFNRLQQLDFQKRRISDLIVICNEDFVTELIPKDANFHRYIYKISVYGKVSSNIET
jgi:hypothetical protein